MFLKRYLIFGIIFILLSTGKSSAFLFNNKDKLQSPDYMTNYLYGSLLYNEKRHNSAAKYLDRIDKLQELHFDYDIKKVNTNLINSELEKAADLVFDTDDTYKNVFIFNFVKAIYYLKEGNYNEASKELKKTGEPDLLFAELKKILNFWINIQQSSSSESEEIIRDFKSRYSSISIINQHLASSFIKNEKLYEKYNAQVLKSENLVRYKILSAWNEIRNGNKSKALKIINESLKLNSNNLLLKQSYVNFMQGSDNIQDFFDPSNFNHHISEIFYLFSNLYQQRSDIMFSEVLLGISLDFNEKFISNKLIMFENKIIENPDYKFNSYFLNNLKNIGSEYDWFVNYQLLKNDQIKSIKNLENKIKSEKFFLESKYLDLANYLRAKKEYTSAIKYYDRVEAEQKDLNWTFYYFRGICFERTGDWKKAEINLTKAISLSPKQYTVINYLAYSWLERRENIDKATKMLEEAVKLSQWNLGYIIDSLGWAYFIKGDYNKAEKLLKIAYEKTPSEGEVYDHYGDVLWKQKKYLQARYVWKNALTLESTDDKRKSSLQNKIVNGLKKSD